MTGSKKNTNHNCKKKQGTNSKEFVESAVLGFFLSFLFILYILILLYLIFLRICRCYHQPWLVQHQDQQIPQGFPTEKPMLDSNAMEEWKFSSKTWKIPQGFEENFPLLFGCFQK